MKSLWRSLRTHSFSTTWYGAIFIVLLLQISGLSPLIGLTVSNVATMVSVEFASEAEAPLDGSEIASVLAGFPEVIHSLYGSLDLKRKTIADFSPRGLAIFKSISPPILLRPPEA